jgi:EAL domain-containing protein (putative c-di-GMP-specific phosphodiesterase class I)
MQCADCETFHTKFYDTTDLYLWFPLQHSLAKFASNVPPEAYKAPASDGDAAVLTLPQEALDRCLTTLAGVFTPEEAAGTKVLPLAHGQTPALTDMGRIINLEQLISTHHGRWLIGMIERRSYTSMFQPIVSAATGKVFAHESLFRGFASDGSQINPGYMFDLANRANILFQLDLAARRCAVETAATGGLQGASLFINFNPSSIYDPSYCLRTTASAIAENGFTPGQIVFEVVESDRVKDIRHLKGILAFYRSAGFKIALDDVGAGYSGLNMLKDLWPDFLKIDMHLVRGVDTDSFRQSIVRNIVTIAKENGIRVVAEGIETEAECNWLKAAGVDLLQGYLLGRPRSAADSRAALAA